MEYSNLQRFREILYRYMELFPDNDRELISHIQAANIYLELASQDVDTLHQKYVSKSLSIDSFYKLMVKVDTLLDTFICLTKLLNISNEVKEQSKKDGTQDVINRFLAFRSLSIAHPLNTNRHEKYGFDGTVWLEDIVDLNDNYSSLFNRDKYNGADFLLKEICYQGEELSIKCSRNQPINLDEEVFEIARIIEDKMGPVNDYLLRKIAEKENEYKQCHIELSTEFNQHDLALLCNETLKRYPSLICEDSWPLGDLYELLEFAKRWHRSDLVTYIKNCILLYKKQLQQMEFSVSTVLNDKDNSINKVRALLKPNLTILARKAQFSTNYSQEKINLYLKPNENRDVDVLLSSTEESNRFNGINANSVFALQQLDGLCKKEPELDIHFIDENGDSETNRSIYFQYVVAMFYYNRKYQTVLKK